MRHQSTIPYFAISSHLALPPERPVDCAAWPIFSLTQTSPSVDTLLPSPAGAQALGSCLCRLAPCGRTLGDSYQASANPKERNVMYADTAQQRSSGCCWEWAVGGSGRGVRPVLYLR